MNKFVTFSINFSSNIENFQLGLLKWKLVSGQKENSSMNIVKIEEIRSLWAFLD